MDQEPDDATWTALAAAARAAVDDRARAGTTITYDELRAELGHDLPATGGRSLAGLLRQLSTESAGRGEGMLSALVVRAGSGRPGGGFFRLAQELGRDVTDFERCWLEECRRVYSAAAYGR